AYAHPCHSMTRTVKDFRAVRPGTARVYSCGPTVYSFQHIGNMRAYVFTDTLARALRFEGLDVTPRDRAVLYGSVLARSQATEHCFALPMGVRDLARRGHDCLRGENRPSALLSNRQRPLLRHVDGPGLRVPSAVGDARRGGTNRRNPGGGSTLTSR